MFLFINITNKLFIFKTNFIPNKIVIILDYINCVKIKCKLD